MAISDAFKFLKSWWDKINPDDRANIEFIESGLRAELPGSDREKDVTSPCQYWVKGLSAVCSNWSNEKCNYSAGSPEDSPSGYGVGYCDGLGRREWCSKYTAGGEDDPEEYVCVLPCLEKSGFGKQIETVAGYVSLRPFKIFEIKGYNEKSGVGQCDGKGMGRGAPGFGVTSVKELYKKRPICLHYRPWSMGFGAVTPRPFPDVMPTTLAELHDGSPSDPLMPIVRRLPFAFDVYNSRVYYQKCANWDSDFGSAFFFDANSGSIIIDAEPTELCTCTESESIPYKTITEYWPAGVPYVLSNVWADYGGIVCNGAKPECPCYTGEWTHCIDDSMHDGMRITADQLLELRFWASAWDNKKDYDDYYKRKPGVTSGGNADETTSDIYTFTYWKKLNPIDPNESIMMGMKHNLCVPVPLHNRDFDPKIYIKKEQVQYPLINSSTGTNAPGAVAFPTLVRALEFPEDVIPPLEIIYPYNTLDPWKVVPCSQDDTPDYCIHNSNQMVLPGPEIGIIGYTVRNKEVYFINKNLVPDIPALSKILNYKRADKVPFKQRKKFNAEIKKLIDKLKEDNSKDTKDGFCMGVADSHGFFGIGTLKLKYEETNTIIVICKYATDSDGNDSYSFRVRKVLSKFYGGYINQTTFTYDILEGSTNYLPVGFYPVPSLSGEVKFSFGQIATIFSVFSLYMKGIDDEYVAISYCVNEYTETVDKVEKWTKVGSTEYVYAEIDNIDLSYIFYFEVTKATLKYVGSEKEMCGGTKEVKLTPASVGRYGIPPNAVILKAEKILGFTNKDWELSIKYKYEKLENFIADGDDAKVSWPEGITTGKESFYRFIESPYTVTNRGASFTIKGNHTCTYAVMAYIADKDTRVQAAVATKLLSCISYTGCRNVDIFYSYTADAVGYELQPNGGQLTWRGADKVLSGDNKDRKHSKTPMCGDHECNPSACVGPMWFPYNDCSSEDYYNVRLPSAQCTMRISEGDQYVKKVSYVGWRYCQASEYEAWNGLGGNWASSCGASWTYYYSKANLGSMRFTGKARIRGPIDIPTYIGYKWALPPFGNTGREYTERWLSKEVASFIDLTVSPPVTRVEYMPHVIDDVDIFLELNCFSSPNSHGPVMEPFSHLSQLSLFNAGWISEKNSTTRYRFDEIFDIIQQNPCTYPPPALGNSGDVISRYGFKFDNLCWAWQEWWKEIERGLANIKGIKFFFNFLSLYRPDYKYDETKNEFRLITYEGTRSINFVAPEQYREYDPISEVWASISIEGAHPRKFKVIYDEKDYSSDTYADWLDEGTIYEKTMNPKDGDGGFWSSIGDWISSLSNEVVAGQKHWCHDYNTIYDSTASTSPDEDCTIQVGETKTYFNRGLIANISKNRLIYLPMEEKYVIMKPASRYAPMLGYFTSDDDIRWQGDLTKGVPTKVIIKGKWGVQNYRKADELRFCLPYITVAEHHETTVFGTSLEDVEPAGYVPMGDFPSIVLYQHSGKYAFDSYTEGAYGSLYDFNIEIELSKTPDHMCRKIDYFQLKLECMQDENIKINSVEAWSSNYINAKESIKVWERRYLCSTLSDENKNPDGLKTKSYRAPSEDKNARGQYFPFSTASSDLQGEIKANDKMTMINSSKFYPDPDMFSATPFTGGGGGTFGGGGASGAWGEETNTSISTGGAIQASGKLNASIGNLKTIEKEEQRKLYEDALNRDKYDTLTLTPFVPIKFSYFAEKIGLSKFTHGNLVIKSNKLVWKNHHLVKSFIQDGLEFFSLGGHYFTWNPAITKTRCMLIGPVEDVYSVDFAHHRHGKPVPTAWAGEAYAGWVRLAYLEGRLAAMQAVTGSTAANAGQPVDIMTAAINLHGAPIH